MAHSITTEEKSMSHEEQNLNGKPDATNPLKLLAEELIQFKEVPPLLQKRVHTSTAWRWANRGINGIKLETVKVGGKRLTSVQAVTRFLKRTSKH
ncbi:protein containing DUF1580 [Rhodopirellula baltica WH47]|uniref:Protein containing DUF1580 n=2 Tax=Rhodopirellula baltica TaxID=265606 RepID=F2AKB0_RHOBT|nr:protein containing DUF1580 [Rhodopirellula baltica WH47]